MIFNQNISNWFYSFYRPQIDSLYPYSIFVFISNFLHLFKKICWRSKCHCGVCSRQSRATWFALDLYKTWAGKKSVVFAEFEWHLKGTSEKKENLSFYTCSLHIYTYISIYVYIWREREKNLKLEYKINVWEHEYFYKYRSKKSTILHFT